MLQLNVDTTVAKLLSFQVSRLLCPDSRDKQKSVEELRATTSIPNFRTISQSLVPSRVLLTTPFATMSL
jgi:hypothetical protein